jgi:hypothetical protein
MRRPPMPGPLPGLVEALAPLGMPDARSDSRSRYRSSVSRICAVCLPSPWARPSVINVAVAAVIHLAAIRYIFLPIGAV